MMMTRPSISEQTEIPQHLARSLVPAELFSRYRYVEGASGNRYLFTAIDRSEAADYAHGVMLLLDETGEVPLWIGSQMADERDDAVIAGSQRFAPFQQVLAKADRIFVHLLASTASDRADVVADVAATFQN